MNKIYLKWENTLIPKYWIIYSLLSMCDPLFLTFKDSYLSGCRCRRRNSQWGKVCLICSETWYAFKEKTVYVYK